MRKLLLTVALVATTLTATLFTGTTEVKAASNNSNLKANYKQALEDIKGEKTDVYALDHYKFSPLTDNHVFEAKVKEITEGITNDYDKAEAIFYWVVENVTYTYDEPANLTGIEFYQYGDCTAFTVVTAGLCRAAGIPTKEISGASYSADRDIWGPHEWNRLYVDGRWIHVDTTFGEFDLTVEEWSVNHILGSDIKDQDAEAYDGTLMFYDFENEKVLKEVKNFPVNGLVTETYGFDINSLFLDKLNTKPFTLNTYKVNAVRHIIYVKTEKAAKSYNVTFNSNGGTKVATIKATAKKVIAKPSNPTRSGYKFAGWYKDAKLTTKWDFATDKVTGTTTLYAGWTKTYSVSFNSNKGTAVKTQTIGKNKLVTQPSNPTRSGYKFVAWYKDAKLTTKWDFAKDKVTANTTLYAGWVKTYKVTFNSNKGTAVKTVTATNKATIKTPTAPTKTGYKFAGWYKDAKLTTKWDFAKDKVTADTVLFAKWTKTK